MVRKKGYNGVMHLQFLECLQVIQMTMLYGILVIFPIFFVDLFVCLLKKNSFVVSFNGFPERKRHNSLFKKQACLLLKNIVGLANQTDSCIMIFELS